MVRISLCMIVRDEQCFLPRCLDSVRGVVDELCVVDTGSTDRTVEIARAHGARIEHFTWIDDYAAARNVSLAMATGDWILVLDADEALATPDARARLEAFAREHPRRAGQITIVDQQEQGELRSRLTRFLPRRDDLRYVERFHEQPSFGGRPCATAHTGVEVLHEGYRAEVLTERGKLERNRAFLERLCAEQPTEPYFHYQLGRTYLLAGDSHAALGAFASALDHVETDAPYLPLLAELACHSMQKVGRAAEALELLQGLAPAWPDRADTRYLEGLLAIHAGRPELAERSFLACFDMPASDGRGGATADVARSWGPAYHLGVIHECRGDLAGARGWYAHALRLRPGHLESLAGLERLATVAGRG